MEVPWPLSLVRKQTPPKRYRDPEDIGKRGGKGEREAEAQRRVGIRYRRPLRGLQGPGSRPRAATGVERTWERQQTQARG